MPWAAAGTAIVVGIAGGAAKTGHLDTLDAALTALHLHGAHAPHLPGLPHGKARALPHGGSSSLTREIDRQTRNPHVRTAMRVGALLEGGSLTPNPATGRWPCGDSGWSCGPYQIHRRANPGVSVAESQNPRFAVAYMLPRYAAGCASVPAARWRTDPRGAAATCAYRAERPRNMYPARRVAAAWARLGGK